MKPGNRVGRYVLGEKIGEGAMAQVFASSHPVLERRVAIKVLKKEACADPHYVTRFLEDARVAHGLDHPNIVRVLDVDDSGEQPFIVMELVDGSSLDGWLPVHRLEVGEAARIARDVAQALQVAHEAGMVHRDIKPSNVLIDRNSAVVKLTDFGAAKRERPGAEQLTEMGQRIGTPRYMAPEQIDGRAVDTRADLFALGATLYELLTNKPAFEGNTVSAVFHAILFSEPRPLGEVRPDTPPELVGLVGRLLAKAPEARPRSAKEVAAELQPFVTGAAPDPLAVTADPVSTTAAPPLDATGDTGIGVGEATDGWRGLVPKNRLVPVLAAAALLVVGIGAWWFLSPGPTPEEPEVVTTAPEPEPDTAVLEPEPEPDTATPPPEPEPDTAALEPEPEPETTAPQPEPEPDTAALEPEPETTAAPEPESDTAALEPEPEPETTTPQPEPEPDIAALPPEPLPTTLECAAGSGSGCALAAQALSALQTPASESPIVVLNRPDGIYLDQDYLVIETELPPGLGGYLYLDVLTDAGNVYHLLPEPMRIDNELPAGGEIRVGVEASERRDGVRFWQVGEPFGEGYLLATVSEKPLYPTLRAIEETIADYQDVLLEALADPATGKKWAQVERIEFRPRGG